MRSSSIFSVLALATLTLAATTTTTKKTTTKTTSTKKTTTKTTTKVNTKTTAPVSIPPGVTTTLPPSTGVTSTSLAITVSSSFDGGYARFERDPVVCQGQTETTEPDAMFVLEPGATLSNVIIGASQAEGVHCRGTCTLNNVWWADVCEDAATFKHTEGTSYVNGGGAFGASDKILQFNGRGTVSVKNFYANDYGKVSRSCGDCTNNGGPRNFIFENVVAIDGGVLCGINTNYGDHCTLTNVCQPKGKFCDLYIGVNNHTGESTKTGPGPDGTYCIGTGLYTNC